MSERAKRWAVRLSVLTLLVVAAVTVLTHLDTQVHTPVGAAGEGLGSFPVVEIAGLGSNGSSYDLLTRTLQAEGTKVLDFDPSAKGVQPLTYEPRSSSSDIPDVARTIVGPAIRAALERAGLNPDTQRIDVVAHSTGGLLMRYLIEHPVANWARRVDDLVLVAVPDHGSSVVWLETRKGHFQAMGADMKPDSGFLSTLGYAEPRGQTYTTIGGDPWEFRWFRHGHHGFDDQVPAESPFLTGAANNTYPYLHGHLLREQDVVDLITATLRARRVVPPPGTKPPKPPTEPVNSPRSPAEHHRG